MADDPMWCLVMFDLPVETKSQRREATRFRHDLLDWGFCMVQFSVYVKYWPTGGQDHATLRAIKTHLPEGGQVRVLALTDRQWATGLRFDNAKPRKEPGCPEQLMIF
ncbi:MULTISPECIES: CRISPR-associated endonuclease Cas2 [Micrococcales]|mgnify:FL=1|uniref:CRISPR-associated endonuclease Cas2 n=1 Tax=Micrococcales TaxID=85006 RepID=UPI00065F7FAA|nr:MULTISPECIES: CRISPR-associated endonuclease Cas2 [Micrococcales]